MSAPFRRRITTPLLLNKRKQTLLTFILQLWGGGFYLTNKILFALAEGRPESSKRALRMAGWAIYILGVPPWVMILISDRNWIAASIEAGGVPAMLFGLYTVYKGSQSLNHQFNAIASFFTYGSLVLGVGTSVIDQQGINTLSQVLELGVMVGFLLGSYLLAKRNPRGWLLFMLMNGSMAALDAASGQADSVDSTDPLPLFCHLWIYCGYPHRCGG